MGLRCTVFGHTWGSVAVDRDREENGGEVVVTVREVRTCTRCGAEEVLGESMEVTALEDPDEAPDARGPDPEAPPAHDDEEPAERDPETDDGVILDEDAPADEDRGPGEWPGRPKREGVEEPDEPGPWPESARETGDEDVPEESFVGADEAPARASAGGGEVLDESSGEEATRDEDSAERADRDEDPGERADRDEDADDGPAGTGGSGTDGVPPADDDGIIEAGGSAEDSGTGETEAAEIPRVDEGAGTTADGDDAGAGVPAGDDADDTPTDATETDSEGDVPPDGPGGAEDRDTSEERHRGESADEEPAGTADGEPAMGADAEPRPDDDAELLEATEPNEQSRVTAEEPVDPEHPEPSDSGPAAGGDVIDGGDPSEPSPADPGDGSADGSPSLDPTEPPSEEEPAPEDIEFYCPECGYVDDSKWPSRRAGDICPDCQRSYLAERKI